MLLAILVAFLPIFLANDKNPYSFTYIYFGSIESHFYNGYII